MAIKELHLYIFLSNYAAVFRHLETALYFRGGRFLFLRGARGLQLEPSVQDVHHGERDTGQDRTHHHPGRPQHSDHLQVPEDRQEMASAKKVFSPVLHRPPINLLGERSHRDQDCQLPGGGKESKTRSECPIVAKDLVIF